MNLTQLRSGLLGIRTLASRDLAQLFRQVSTAAQAREALEDILPQLIEEYGAAAAALAADWYDDAREKAGVGGSFTAVPAVVGDRGAGALARWGLTPAFGGSGFDAARTLTTGGLARRISDLGRETIMISTTADPQAEGWQRFASGGCAFCQMLAGRGAVYTSSSADFASHDSCSCTAAPAFKGQPRPVRPYQPSARVGTDADRARVREWLAAN